MKSRVSYDNLVVLIPARGGSKGLPGKNLCFVGERTLLDRAIDCGLSVAGSERVFVSSDSKEILNAAKGRGVVPLVRSSAASADEATANMVIEEFCQTGLLKRQASNPTIVYLQPTSPFRSADDVITAVELFANSFTDGASVISVCKSKNIPQKMYQIDKDSKLAPLCSIGEEQFQNRQLLPKYYSANGAIYIFKLNCFLKKKCIPTRSIIAFEMNANNSVDIDEEFDLLFANFIEAELVS